MPTIIDGNEAAASVAYRCSETIAIYPITPSSAMAESADEWSAKLKPNLWGTIPKVVEMQSEGGAAGAIHGMLQAGALSTTFTASQGLLLMIPNLYKIAGELTPFCMHVSARTLATHALSIFGDHSDVMACRQIGFAMLCSGSVQEAHDFAAIAHSVTFKSRIPFMHFFDGFRTSHELAKIEILSDENLKSLMSEKEILEFRKRALSPDHPQIRGTAQNPDVFFQAREACNPYYSQVPKLMNDAFEQFQKITGRKYSLFDYYGAPDADRVMIMMGSGSEAVQETIEALQSQGEKVGLIRVRLYRPFSVAHLLKVLPKTVKRIAVLDRTKEPGAVGEPLYQDVLTGLAEALGAGVLDRIPLVVGGRYGLSSKEFTPAMAKGVLDELKKDHPKNHFTIGIVDDVSQTSLSYDSAWDIESKEVTRCLFYGLGSDGTVGANKNSIKIIGEETSNFAQGYFVYDSKKSGAITISHLRFGPKPIRSSYLIRQANFIAIHHWDFLEKIDVLDSAQRGAVVLLNTQYSATEVWNKFSKDVQAELIEKNLKLFVIDGSRVARETQMGNRINTIMQTCFFAISGVLPREEAISQIKKSIEKSYAKKGADVVQKNFQAVDQTLAALQEVKFPKEVSATRSRSEVVSKDAPEFVKKVTSVMMAGKGDLLPVSAFPVDGTWPTGTTKFEKSNVGSQIPVWDSSICIQCNKCSFVCPHAAIRGTIFPSQQLATDGAKTPATFKFTDYKLKDVTDVKYSIQVAPEDCTGCGICIEVCPAKDKANPRHRAINLEPKAPLRDQEKANFEYFLTLPTPDRSVMRGDPKTSQFLEPLFEFSGACAGCGETPYIKLLTQLYGDRLLIANATGCSSIYGGNLPTTPYTKNREGRGPAWANSLFEDNAEFGFGIRFGVDQHQEVARSLIKKNISLLGETLVSAILFSEQNTEAEIFEQRKRVLEIRSKLKSLPPTDAQTLDFVADYLVKKSVWIVGGDGWAYDIGFGGLDHVLSQGRKVNILVMDTEVYSNTGGQASKATPMGASAKFAVAGKVTPKKDLGLIAMSYGNVYVARVAFGAKDLQTVQVFQEAESFPGTSIIIAYSHCIAHGYGMHLGLAQQKLAVDSGYWPLFRFDPRRAGTGESELKLDSPAPKVPLKSYIANEMRYRMLEKVDPVHAQKMQQASQDFVNERYKLYEYLSKQGKNV